MKAGIGKEKKKGGRWMGEGKRVGRSPPPIQIVKSEPKIPV